MNAYIHQRQSFRAACLGFELNNPKHATISRAEHQKAKHGRGGLSLREAPLTAKPAPMTHEPAPACQYTLYSHCTSHFATHQTSKVLITPRREPMEEPWSLLVLLFLRFCRLGLSHFKYTRAHFTEDFTPTTPAPLPPQPGADPAEPQSTPQQQQQPQQPHPRRRRRRTQHLSVAL